MCVETKKFIPCRKCPSKNGGPQPGYYYDTLEGYTVIKECSCHKKWREDAELALTFNESNIAPDYTFDNYCGTKSFVDLNCLRMIAQNPEKFTYKKMVYLYGPNGCQKSTMVQALGKELILKGYTVHYTLMSDLITNLVSDFSDTEENKEKKEYFVNRCMNCDFLIIDEAFDLDNVSIYASGYQIPYLDSFIRNRFEIGKKSIIFVSNKAPKEISEVTVPKGGDSSRKGFGKSLQSLVERNTKQSTLVFRDVWLDSVNQIDRMGLFK